MIKPHVKICCISSVEEAKTAIAYGASAIGLVGKMPGGPGIINDDLIKKITEFIPSRIESFLLTSNTSTEGIIQHHKKVNTSVIQIVDRIPFSNYAEIRSALPGIQLVQVVHIRNQSSVIEAVEVSQYVDRILLDSGNPDLLVKELGGTGKTHNWLISKKIRERVKIPIILAGGLNSKNVSEAIEVVQPFGIDICSGVRTDGKLDKYKLQELFKTIESGNDS